MFAYFSHKDYARGMPWGFDAIETKFTTKLVVVCATSTRAIAPFDAWRNTQDQVKNGLQEND